MAKQWWEEAPLAQEQRGEWWEAAPLAQAPAQPKQDEWWKAAPKLDAEEKPQATTSNPFMGILGRAASLAGAGVGATGGVAVVVSGRTTSGNSTRTTPFPTKVTCVLSPTGE